MKTKYRKAGVTVVISDEIDLKTKNFTKKKDFL